MKFHSLILLKFFLLQLFHLTISTSCLESRFYTHSRRNIRWRTSPDSLKNNISLLIVGKYNRTPFSVELNTKFQKYIPQFAGILLHSAITKNRSDILECLVNVGATLDGANNVGLTPLYKAIVNNNTNAVGLLVRCGADTSYSEAGLSLLHAAILRDETHAVLNLIELGSVVDTEDLSGKTPLYHAIELKKATLVEALLSAGADVNYITNDGRRLLHIAVSEKKVDIAKALIKLNSLIDVEDGTGSTPLYLALVENHTDIIEVLIRNGANVDFVSKAGEPLIHTAISSGNVNVVKKLIELGASSFSVDSNGLTPILRAIKDNNTEIVNCLIKNDIISMKEFTGGDYPLNFAVINSTPAVVKLLLENGVKKETINSKGLTPLVQSIFSNRSEITELFLWNDSVSPFDMNYSIDRKNNRPLHLAVMNNDIATARRLLARGASVESYNRNQITPLHIAVENDNPAMIRLLFESMNLKKGLGEGDSLLHFSVARGSKAATRKLIDLGYDITRRDKRRTTPLQIALSINDTQTVDLLLSKGAKLETKSLYEVFKKGSLNLVKKCLDFLPSNDTRRLPILESVVRNNRADVVKLFTLYNVSYVIRADLLQKAAGAGAEDVLDAFLRMGLPVDLTFDAYTPLWTATSENKTDSMRLLLENGADVQQPSVSPFSFGQGQRRWTLLHQAVYKNLIEATALLLDYGMDVNSRDVRSWTALHYAATMKAVDMAKLLIKRGADVQAKTRNGITPLDLVVYNDDKNLEELANLLVSKRNNQTSSTMWNVLE